MNQPPDTISVLLPLHAGVDRDDLAAAIESILIQTVPADEVVIVEDGPLPESHSDLLGELEVRHPNVVRVLLEVNRGAGVANQAGLLAASGTWIAKADSDDRSVEQRFELQLSALAESGADVCGGAMLEFDQDERRPTALRSTPLSHAAISRRMRLNNPVNHPTAMYRRDLAVRSGGYPDYRYMQDYVLFARMLQAGAQLINLSQPLVRFRGGERLQSRRRDPAYVRLEWELQKELQRLGLIRRARKYVNFVSRVAYRKLPARAMRRVHLRVLSSAPPPD